MPTLPVDLSDRDLWLVEALAREQGVAPPEYLAGLARQHIADEFRRQ